MSDDYQDMGERPPLGGNDATSRLPDTNPELAHLIAPDGARHLLAYRPGDEPSDPEEFAVHYQQEAQQLRAKLTAAETRLKEAECIIVDLLEIDFIERLTSIDEVPGVYECVYCGGRGKLEEFFHEDDCPVERARKWREERGT